MKQETIADKLAKRTVQSKGFQKSWAVHMKSFGPILEPAFPDNDTARVHLAAALNMISNRNFKGGLDKLDTIRKFCRTDADKAARAFFMGVCCEMAGQRERMMSCYLEAGKYQHRFYLPYMKVGQNAQLDGRFELAEEHYRRAIACLEGEELDEQEQAALSAVHANLATSLMMMQRYEQARAEYEAADRILPAPPGRMASQAMLHALMGREEQAKELLARVEGQDAELARRTGEEIQKIQDGTHPRFFHLDMDRGQAEMFWAWFRNGQDMLVKKLKGQQYDRVFALLQEQMKPVFPFLEEEPELGILPLETGYQLTFVDGYMISLCRGYEDLLALCPEDLKENWRFEIRH